jgi:endonuclease/exonuclease/phosphatase (EEP) superfamily protein YafD
VRAADLDLSLVRQVPPRRLAGVTVLARTSLRPGDIKTGIGGESAAIAVTLGDQRIEILGVHPPSPTTGIRSDTRDDLLAAAADWVGSRDREVIVVGDLNATPWSHATRSLRRSAGLTDTRRGFGLQATWPAALGALSIPIDHVLVTAGLGFEERRTGPALGSAHRPVLVVIGPSG